MPSNAPVRLRSSPVIVALRRPPGAPHHYHFTVYALSAPLDAKEGLDKAGLLKAMEGKIVGQGEIVGVFQTIETSEMLEACVRRSVTNPYIQATCKW